MMKQVTLLLLSLLLIQSSFGKSEISPTKLLPYKKTEKGDLKLHAFFPEGYEPTDNRAAVVFFFGGGWKGGTPKQFYGQAKALSEKGMVTFCAEYRTKGKHGTSPFECVKDAKSAVRWIRENAKDLGIDPERIVAAGGSAGGHIAACTGVIKGYEEESKVSSIPNAMILFNPVLDTTEKGYGAERFSADQKEIISPCHHVKKGNPPTLVMHGSADKVVPFENAHRFTKLMAEAGNKCLLKSYEGQKHGFFNGKIFRPTKKSDAMYQATLKETITFLDGLGYLK